MELVRERQLVAHTYVYRAVPGFGAEPLDRGRPRPSTQTRRERWIVFGIGIGGFVLLILSFGAAILVALRLGKPVLGSAAAARVEALEFAGARTLPRGPVREINQAAAVERMAAQDASVLA